jgi:translation elongation factor EF-G
MSREYTLNLYRNFGIMAHIDAGKTTCCKETISEKEVQREIIKAGKK